MVIIMHYPNDTVCVLEELVTMPLMMLSFLYLMQISSNSGPAAGNPEL